MRAGERNKRARGTHGLESAEGHGTSHDNERKGVSESTHILESTEGGTNQGTERKRVREGRDHRIRIQEIVRRKVTRD